MGLKGIVWDWSGVLGGDAYYWLFDDFRNACVALRALAKSGRIKGLKGALAPLVTDVQKKIVHLRGYFPGALSLPGLWQGFAWGSGGTVVADGQFRVTDPATVEGISNLVDLGRQFALSQADALSLGFGLAFELYHPGPLPSGWQWARLPRFPVQPVIPTVSVAQALAYVAPTPAPAPDAPDVRAAAEYLLWWYTPDATTLLIAEGSPPALADPSVQTRYWQGKAGGADAVGDWHNFRDCFSGFPSTVPDQVMFNALNQAIARKVSVQTALATAQQDINNQRYLAAMKAPNWYGSLPPTGQ